MPILPPAPPPEHENVKQYTIQVPGIQDFIAIRPLESKALYYERLKRMQENNTALPDSLKWAPKLIGILDDAQDLLYTALVLSKPLIKRLPAKLIPGVGWLLLANDVLNLGVMGAGLLTNGAGGKAKLARTLDAWTGGAYRNFNQLLSGKISLDTATKGFKRSLTRNVNQFVKGNHKFGAIIQGAQAAYTITSWAGKKAQELELIEKKPAHWQTGVGLQLGAAMGFMTDAIWSAVKLPFSGPADLTGPPKNDIGSKAARYLLNSFQANEVHDLLSPADHSLLIAANAIAADVVAQLVDTERFIERFDTATSAPPPHFTIWNPTSSDMLRRFGYDPSGYTGTLQPPGTPSRSIGDQLERAATQQAPWEEAMSRVLGKTTHATLMQILNQQAGEDLIGAALNEGHNGKLTLSPQEAISLRCVEWNLYPLPWPSEMRAEQLLNRGDLAQYQAEFNPAGKWQTMCNSMAEDLIARGSTTPTRQELQDGLVRFWGGWQTR